MTSKFQAIILTIICTLFVISWNTVFAVDGGWSDWTNWTPCSSSCGPGQRRRVRTCDNPRPLGGRYCEGRPSQTEECEAPLECSINGGWSQWTEWTACSITCGEGVKRRFRTCNSPFPSGGGRDCEGSLQESEACAVVRRCPRDGNWSSWSKWSQCSVTCGSGGSLHRYRACNNPPPANDGVPCKGLPHESKDCSGPVRCPVNGQWTEWTGWTECSVTCGSGEQRRWRTCDNPPAQHGGDDCNRSEDGELQVRSCNGSKIYCPVDGGWSDWGEWGSCNARDCTSDKTALYSFRQRSCNSPFPAHEGSMCQGTFLNARTCQEPTNCVVNGGWSDWSDWNCDESKVYRTRLCNNPEPSNGGKKCKGDNSQFFQKDTDKYTELCPDFPKNDAKEKDEAVGLENVGDEELGNVGNEEGENVGDEEVGNVGDEELVNVIDERFGNVEDDE